MHQDTPQASATVRGFEAAATNTPPDPGRLIRLPGVLGLVPLGRTAFLGLVKEKKAPQPVKIGRATFWVEREIRDFITERIRAHRGQQAPS